MKKEIALTPIDRPEYIFNDGKPIAILYKKFRAELTDPCPFCGRKHGHGIGIISTHSGHRLTHCDESIAKAQITAKDGTKILLSDGYVIAPYRLIPKADAYANLGSYIDAVDKKRLPADKISQELLNAINETEIAGMPELEKKYSTVIIEALEAIDDPIFYYAEIGEKMQMFMLKY